MFYKEIILSLFSNMFNGTPSHRIKRLKFLHTTFKVFPSLVPSTILNVLQSQPTQRQLSETSYHILPPRLYSSCYSLFHIHILPNHNIHISKPKSHPIFNSSNITSLKICFKFPALVELNSPSPVFPYCFYSSIYLWYLSAKNCLCEHLTPAWVLYHKLILATQLRAASSGTSICLTGPFLVLQELYLGYNVYLPRFKLQ